MLEAITLNGSNVTAEIDAYIHDNVFNYNGVYDYGNKLEASITSNNVITLKDGLLISQGRFLRIKPGTTEQVKIKSGRSGVTRKDLIVAHFETDGSDEIYDIRVLTGVDNGDVPKHTQGNTFAGERVNELPLYVVSINGINIENVEKRFKMLCSSNNYLNKIAQQNLLINGDFQINQRGKKEYSPSGFENTLDMWGITNMVLNVLPDDWIKIRNKDSADAHGLRQSFDGKTGNHMLCLNIRNLMGKAKVLISHGDGSSQEIGDVKNGRNEFKIIPTKPFTKIALNLQESASCEVEYIDLFPGDIAYPHVKEDYSTALYRCQEYLIKIQGSLDAQLPLVTKPIGGSMFIMIDCPQFASRGQKITIDASPRVFTDRSIWEACRITDSKKIGTKLIIQMITDSGESYLKNSKYLVQYVRYASCEPL